MNNRLIRKSSGYGIHVSSTHFPLTRDMGNFDKLQSSSEAQANLKYVLHLKKRTLQLGNYPSPSTYCFFPYFVFTQNIFYFFKDYIYLFLEEGREEEREKHQCVIVSCALSTGDLACNPGMCPGWESNQRPFGSQAGTQSTMPQQGADYLLKVYSCWQYRKYFILKSWLNLALSVC